MGPARRIFDGEAPHYVARLSAMVGQAVQLARVVLVFVCVGWNYWRVCTICAQPVYDTISYLVCVHTPVWIICRTNGRVWVRSLTNSSRTTLADSFVIIL